MCLLQIYWKIPGFLKQMKIFKKKQKQKFHSCFVDDRTEEQNIK